MKNKETREEVIKSYLDISKQYGESPSRDEFIQDSGISKNYIKRLFGFFGALRLAAEGKVDFSKEEPIVKSNGKNLDDVLESCGVDQNIWDVNEFNTKELSNGEFLFTVYLKKKRVSFDIEKFKDELRSISPIVPKIDFNNKNEELLLEFSFPDYHWGKLCWEEESGHNYDMKIAKELLKKATDFTLLQASKFNISKIILPFGNDFFTTDSLFNTTTGGTPQSVDSRHHKMFRDGYKLIIEIVERLKTLAPVKILGIPGNHDQSLVLYSMELFDAYYHNDQNVEVDTSAVLRKYYKWGSNLLGYTHGNREKINDLAILMATEMPKEWALTKYRVWHIGHTHTRKLQIDEKCGVQVRTMPAISGVDAWHFEKGFTGNIRGTTSTIYDKNLGPIIEINCNL